MRWMWKRGVGPIATAFALGLPLGASAQMAPVPPASANPSVPPAAMMMNPYLNPYMNPYLNPAATQRPMGAGNAALFLYQAQAANGGIGSGRLSTARSQAPRTKAAEMPDSSSRPGGGAARFFNPGPVNVNGAGRYYNQRNRRFLNNGR